MVDLETPSMQTGWVGLVLQDIEICFD